MFNISKQSKLNTTVYLSTLGAYDQYFGDQMQKNSEKERKLPKITQCVPFRGQSDAISKDL